MPWGSQPVPSKKEQPDGLDFDPWSELRLADLLTGAEDESEGVNAEISDEEVVTTYQQPPTQQQQQQQQHRPLSGSVHNERQPNNVHSRNPIAPPQQASSSSVPGGGVGAILGNERTFEPLSWAAAVESGAPRSEQNRDIALPPPGLSGRAKSRFGFAQEFDAGDPLIHEQHTHQSHPLGHLHNHSTQPPHPHLQRHDNTPDQLEDSRSARNRTSQPIMGPRPPFGSAPSPVPLATQSPVEHPPEQGIPLQRGVPQEALLPLPAQPHNDMQQTLRALLPNVNISFAPTPHSESGMA